MGCAAPQPHSNKKARLTISRQNASKRFKIVLLGSSAVGKTTLVQKYCSSGNNQEAGPTLGGAHYIKNNQLMNGQDFPLYIWDTAGEQKYRSMASIYYRDADVVILMFDLTDTDSFMELEYWVGELERRIQKEEMGVVVCGNKSDLSRQVTLHSVEIWLKNYPNFMYAEVSAKTGQGVEELFELATEYYLCKYGLPPYSDCPE